MEGRELEDDRPDLRTTTFKRSEKEPSEHFRVEEIWIHRPCSRAKAGQRWELFERDVVGHVEPEFESLWHLSAHLPDVFFRGEFIVTGIDTNGRRLYFQPAAWDSFPRSR